MASMTGNGRRSFPELVGQNVQRAVAYVTAQGKLFFLYNLFMLSCVFYMMLY